MDKISFRDFYMILLPGLVMIYLIQITFPELMNGWKVNLDSFEGILYYAILCYPIGTLIDIFGGKVEQIIDKIKNKPHPIVHIIDNGINGITGVEIKNQIQHVFGINLEGKTEKEYDQTFTIVKEYLYQQIFSDIQKNLTARATLFRNLIAVSIFYILIIIFCHFGYKIIEPSKTCFYEKPCVFKFGIICVCVICSAVLRNLSQSLYIEWFKSTLSNFYIYTKTK